jgi:hypothetical protein
MLFCFVIRKLRTFFYVFHRLAYTMAAQRFGAVVVLNLKVGQR